MNKGILKTALRSAFIADMAYQNRDELRKITGHRAKDFDGWYSDLMKSKHPSPSEQEN